MEIPWSATRERRCCFKHPVPKLQPSISCSHKVTIAMIENVIISQSAYRKIQLCVQNAANRYEVGGILLGRKQNNSCYIDAVTTAKGKSNTSFTLDGNTHLKIAQTIMDNSTKIIELLGVWHSHICDFGIFSMQDKCANKDLASALGGALSIIATMQETNNVNLHAYYITKGNTEHRQAITIQ